ncbi:hypothetical protein J6590_009096 [Homalodisca vitripennis]|nr:hypothetical protein J6590_009096 [Homalodisca vitripennis]
MHGATSIRVHICRLAVSGVGTDPAGAVPPVTECVVDDDMHRVDFVFQLEPVTNRILQKLYKTCEMTQPCCSRDPAGGKHMERRLLTVKRWFDQNQLTINLHKTKCMAISLRADGDPVNLTLKLHTCAGQNECGCETVERVSDYKYLGRHVTALHERWTSNKQPGDNSGVVSGVEGGIREGMIDPPPAGDYRHCGQNSMHSLK